MGDCSHTLLTLENLEKHPRANRSTLVMLPGIPRVKGKIGGMMEAVKRREYVEPAMNAAYRRADEYWQQAQKFGPVAIPPRIHERLIKMGKKSGATLFSTIYTMAFSGPTEYRREDGTIHGERVMIGKAGGRCWSQRTLAAAAEMAPNTARGGLKDLREAKLIVYDASRWGTWIAVKGFETNRRTWRAMLSQDSCLLPEVVSKTDTLPLRPDVLRSLTSTVDVTRPESRDKKEGDPLEKDRIRAMIARTKRELGIT